MKEYLISTIISLVTIICFIYQSIGLNAKVVFFDVGQGDSMLFVNSNVQILVDGGPDKRLIEKYHQYVPFYDREIELMILTHPHLDHYAGLVSFLEEYSIIRAIVPRIPCNSNELFEAFISKLENHNVEILHLDRFKIGDVEIEIMNNEAKACIKESENINNSSIVTRIKYLDVSILNMGDLEDDTEFEVEQSDILKAGHHCSNTSSSVELITIVDPKVAICSLGENKYGHPSRNVLDRFSKNDINYLITQEEGDIVLNLNRRLIYNQKGKLLLKL